MSTGATTLHDPLLNPTHEFYQNPYPMLGRLREEAPVFWSEKGDYWIVSSHALAHEILGDLSYEKGPPRWRSNSMIAKLFQGGEMSGMGGATMLNTNPPAHTRLRGLVNKAFTPSMIAKLREHIQGIADNLLNEVEKKGKMDMVADYAYPLPAIVIAEMLGVPPQDRERFKGWSHDIAGALDPQPNVLNLGKMAMAYRELGAYLKPLVEQRRKERKDDLISALVGAEDAGQHLSEIEILANSILLLIAGHETTANLIGNGMQALLKHPAALAELQATPALLPTAVNEFLRYDSPVQFVRRIAAQPLELGGQQIKAEDNVIILLGAANRDPKEFENPEQLDIKRTKNKHLAFGHGIHHCLGSSLAQLEGEIAIGTVIRRFPNLKLAEKEPQYKTPFSLRGLKQMHVTF